MKKMKIWSMILMLMMSNVTLAQVYSELDLEGLWIVEDVIGEGNYTSQVFRKTTLYDTEFEFKLPNAISTYSDVNYGKYKLYFFSTVTGRKVQASYTICNVSISSNNVLRMKLYGSNNSVYFLTFIISSITSDSMVWTSLDGGTKVTFRKTNTASNVSENINAPKHPNDYYNLQGVKVEKPKENEVYINNGKKIIK